MYIKVNWEYIYLQKVFKEKNFVDIVIWTEQLLEMQGEKKGFLSQLSHLKRPWPAYSLMKE